MNSTTYRYTVVLHEMKETLPDYITKVFDVEATNTVLKSIVLTQGGEEKFSINVPEESDHVTVECINDTDEGRVYTVHASAINANIFEVGLTERGVSITAWAPIFEDYSGDTTLTVTVDFD